MHRLTAHCRDWLRTAETDCPLQRLTAQCRDWLRNAESDCALQRLTAQCRVWLRTAETDCAMQRLTAQCRVWLCCEKTHCTLFSWNQVKMWHFRPIAFSLYNMLVIHICILFPSDQQWINHYCLHCHLHCHWSYAQNYRWQNRKEYKGRTNWTLRVCRKYI